MDWGLAGGQASWHRTRVKTPLRISLQRLATCLPRTTIAWDPYLPRPPIGHNESTWYRNINLLAIGYALSARLRSD